MGLVLALAMTLVASGAPGTAAERSPRSNAGSQAAKVGAQWVPGHTKAGLAKIQRQAARRAAHQGARFRTFNDRILGAQPVLSYRGAADPTVARYAGGWVGRLDRARGAPRASPRSRAGRGRTSRPP